MSRAARFARWLIALVAVTSFVAFSNTALAQDVRPVRLVVPAPPGGNLDATARLLAQRMAAATGEPWIVDNRSGGGSIVGTEHVVRAQPDGRVLLYHATGIAMLPSMQKLSFSPIDELAPIIQVSTERYALIVPVTSGVTSMKALEQLASTRAGGINCVGVPGLTTIACEQLRGELRGKSTTIPFQGVAPGMQALVGGHMDVMFVTLEGAMRVYDSGRIRVIGVSSRVGLPAVLSQVPLITDQWADLKVEGVTGIFAPIATSTSRVRELNRELNRVLADPEVNAAMRDSGQAPVGGSPDQFGQVIRRAADYYADLIRKLDLGPK